MKKNKGFTLIELLAIIVILAIIAVITVPIILNVIDNAKKGSIKDSAYGYKDAINKYYVSELYENLDLKLNGTYTITDKGRLSNETGVHEIPFTGTTPTGGYLKYQNNILTDGCITMDEYSVTVSNGEITTVEKGSCGEQQVAYKCIRATELHKEECSQTHSTYYCSGAGYTGKEIEYGRTGSGDEPVSGDAFDCDVNGDGEYSPETERFYYVSDLYIGNNSETNEPEYDSNYAVLIYYNNTSVDSNGNIIPDNTLLSKTAYYETADENWYGPVTAINNLPTINDWTNVSLSNTNRAILNENREGTTKNGANSLPTAFSYTKDGVPLAARLLTTQELEVACGRTVGSYTIGELDTCNYLMENTKYSNSSLGTNGYWLETPAASASDSAWYVNGSGRFASDYFVSLADSDGSRPAIEVLKTDIKF